MTGDRDVLDREAALQPPAGEHVEREAGGRHRRLLQLAGAADPVDRRAGMAPLHQRLGQGQPGIDVPARAAPGDQRVDRAFRLFPPPRANGS